jgi:predicted aspartyl protease
MLAVLLAGLTGTSALAQTSYDGCTSGHVWSVPLRIENNQVILNVKLNGRPIEAAFDTGAVTNAIPKGIADAYGLKDANRSMNMVAPGQEPVSMEFYGGDIDIGGRFISNRAFIEPPIVAKRSDIMLMAITAVLETDFYLDTLHGSFSLIDDTECGPTYVPFMGRYRDLPASRPNSGQGAAVNIEINGHLLPATMDTGSDRTIISLHTARELGFSDDVLDRSQKITSTVLTGKLSGSFQTVKRIEFAGKIYNNYEILVENITDDAIIGTDILKDFNIFVSPQRGIFVQEHDQARAP